MAPNVCSNVTGFCRCALALNTSFGGAQVAQPVVHPIVFKVMSTLIRLVNNVVGGMSFVRSPAFLLCSAPS